MGIKEFRLEFNQPIRSFFASQTIRGKVILDLRQAKKIKGLEVQCYGKGKVYWKESIPSGCNSGSATSGTTNSSNNPASNGGSNKKKYSADGLLTTITSNVPIPPILRRGSSQHDKKQRDYVNSNNTTVVPSSILGSNTSQAIMSVEETYLDEKIVLLEKKNCDTILLESGRHEYQFEFKIPSNCPSSFQGPYGDIKYFAEAILTRAKRKQAHRTKILFTVNGLLDLNKDPIGTVTSITSGSPTGGSSGKTTTQASASPPIYTTCETKQFTKSNTNLLACLFCLTSPAGRQGQGKNHYYNSLSPGKINKLKKSGGVGFHFKLHKSFFVPGEYVQFVAEMRNMSNVDVSGVTLSLIQETNYFVGDRVKSGLKQTMATAKGPSVSSGQIEIWETNPNDSLFFQIPSLPPTNLATSKIIEVKYYLQLEMEFYGQKNIKGQVPILIGTIPLRSTFKDFMTIKKKNEEEQSDDEIITEYYKTGCKTSKSFGESLGYPDLATPIYEEAACFTPCLDFSTIGIGGILPNGLSNNKNKSANNGIENHEPSGNDEEEEDDVDDSGRTDSDEEYIIEVNEKGNNDDKFVPLYAKYVTVYGYDD